ncbi:MAG: acyltransferase domain-containing protein [Thermomicrobiales bacterium]
MSNGTDVDIFDRLRTDESCAAWLSSLEALDTSRLTIPPLPQGDAFDDALAWLAAPDDDRITMNTLLPTIAGSADLEWLRARSVASLLTVMDVVAAPHGFPAWPASLGELGRFFYAFVYASILPETRALFAKRGIPEDIQHATMADIGRNMYVHRKRHGTHGLASPDWLMLHARGMIFQLGRLQFERAGLGTRTSNTIQESGFPWSKGDPTLSIHIPDFMGSMSPEACDASFVQAADFFPRYFPEEAVHTAVCNSWLLDTQLRDYLSPASNIIAFQRRFRHIRPGEWANDGPLRFVFGPVDWPLEDYPQETSVQRAVVQHLKDGKDWHGGMGWMEFPSTSMPAGSAG